LKIIARYATVTQPLTTIMGVHVVSVNKKKLKIRTILQTVSQMMSATGRRIKVIVVSITGWVDGVL